MKPKNTDTPLMADCSSAPCSPSSGIPANYIAFNDIPEEVHRAAETLNSYFERQGMREWQFAGVADRRLVNVLERERDRLHDAIRWALGEGEEGFREQCCNEGKYWWRKELRERAAAPSPENAPGESRGIPRTLDPIVGSSSEGAE